MAFEKIEELIVGKDKRERGATVKVSSPIGRMTLINRPLSKLFLVKVKDRYIPTLPEKSVKQDVKNVNKKQSSLLKRMAALDAKFFTLFEG